MNLSVREREVLTAVSLCDVISLRALEHELEARMPSDEVDVVVDSLQEKRAVVVNCGRRSSAVRITSVGRLALEETRHA